MVSVLNRDSRPTADIYAPIILAVGSAAAAAASSSSCYLPDTYDHGRFTPSSAITTITRRIRSSGVRHSQSSLSSSSDSWLCVRSESDTSSSERDRDGGRKESRQAWGADRYGVLVFGFLHSALGRENSFPEFNLESWNVVAGLNIESWLDG